MLSHILYHLMRRTKRSRECGGRAQVTKLANLYVRCPHISHIIIRIICHMFTLLSLLIYTFAASCMLSHILYHLMRRTKRSRACRGRAQDKYTKSCSGWSMMCGAGRLATRVNIGDRDVVTSIHKHPCVFWNNELFLFFYIIITKINVFQLTSPFDFKNSLLFSNVHLSFTDQWSSCKFLILTIAWSK